MARKAIVNRDMVLQLLKEGKSSQVIANQFGVSRQAIDLYRKDFTRTGFLPAAGTTPLPITASAPIPTTTPPPVPNKPVSPSVKQTEVSLDQMIELFIKAFDALKRLPELENEVAEFRREHEGLLQQIAQLEESEKKRKEQETRWLQVQNPDTSKS
jgi:hypothetical protein